MSKELRPRLCYVKQWPHFEGYGFNLHAEKSRVGQYIGKVDEGSPAAAAGLREGDRIIEVNGVNISQENHKQVVQRIKAIQGETRLLVVDKETDAYYRERGEVIRVDDAVFLSTDDIKKKKEEEKEEDKKEEIVTVNNRETTTERRHSGRSNASSNASSSTAAQKVVAVVEESKPDLLKGEKNEDESKVENTTEATIETPPPNTEGNRVEKLSISSEHDEVNSSSGHSSLAPPPQPSEAIKATSSSKPYFERPVAKSISSTGSTASPRSTPSPDIPESSYNVNNNNNNNNNSNNKSSDKNYSGLNLNMTAAEMREIIGSKKKRDPRKDDRMDFRKKYEIIQTL